MVRGDAPTSCSRLTVVDVSVKTHRDEMDAHGRAQRGDDGKLHNIFPAA